MKKLTFIYLGIVIAALCSCNGRKMMAQLDEISKIADDNPDSALTLLSKFDTDKNEWGKGDRMHYELIRLKAENKSGIKFTSDSIIKDVVAYYKDNGNANEIMLAYYLLGRAYSDMEEAPEALQAYYDAISMADTTNTSCDFRTLTVVYGQMSRIFHKQNLPHDEIWALRHYVEYIRRNGNLKDYIMETEQLIRPYYLLNKKDSVLNLINNTYSSLKQLGEHQEAADALVVSISIYLERGDLTKAKHAMDIFEKESGLFDEYGNIAKGREHYYYTKGLYELAINQLGSAEYYFRKAIKYGYLSEGYKGLLSIYREKHNIDSVNCFSRLYEAAQDSLHNKMQTDAIHQMSSLYNYSRSQKEAEQEREKAQDRLYLLSLISFATIVLLIVIIVVVWLYRKNQEEKKARIAELEETLNSAKSQRNAIQEELRILKEKDYESIIAIKEKQEIELSKRIEFLEAKNNNKKDANDITRIDNLENFLGSAIAQQFIKKATSKSERIKPTGTEWNRLSDLGFFFFSTQLFLVLISNNGWQTFSLILLIIGCCFTVYSVVYQITVIHKVCLYCMSVNLITWLDTILITTNAPLPKVGTPYIFIFSVLISYLIWSFTVRNVSLSRQTYSLRNRLSVLYRRGLFEWLLSQERELEEISDNYAECSGINGTDTITVFVHPQCKKCKTVEAAISQLSQIARVKIVSLAAKAPEVRLYCERNQIVRTPTIVVDGHELPEVYDIGDLKYILKS